VLGLDVIIIPELIVIMISKSALGTQMSSEEQRRLKEDLSSLGMDDISSFMEALPRDFYVILRTE